jgi:hypothetical protein
VAGQRLDLVGAEHAGAAAQCGLGLAVVEPGVAACHDQDDGIADPHRQRLGDLPGLDPQRQRRLVDRGGAGTLVDDRDVRRRLREEGTDGVAAHRSGQRETDVGISR